VLGDKTARALEESLQSTRLEAKRSQKSLYDD